MTPRAHNMKWWRFWADTFTLMHGDLQDYWMDIYSEIILPCHPDWHKVYITRYFVANDNYREDGL